MAAFWSEVPSEEFLNHFLEIAHEIFKDRDKQYNNFNISKIT